MIHISQMSYSYPKKDKLFDSMSLSFEKGKIYGLLGKNGMGKSTLLRLIGGYLFPISGDILLDGTSPQKRHPQLTQKIFLLSEEFLLPDLSIEDYKKAYNPFYDAFDHKVFYEVISGFGLQSSSKIGELSYGQKKKFMIAFGLATRATYLILDEPTNGLDIPSKLDFRKILAQYITDEQCVIISTHQIKDLEHILDSIVVIDQGQIIINSDISNIENRLKFELSRSVEKHESVLYQQRVPGGYLNIIENEDNSHTSIEIEAFFNAVIHNKEAITKIFN